MIKIPRKNIFTISFYNVENLFDAIDDPLTFDDDYTPSSSKAWTEYRYYKKIKKMSGVIAQLGVNKSAYAPVLVGLVEVENKRVLTDLINHKNLLKFHYDFVHYDSPDERGIDTALLFQKKHFEFLSSTSYPLELYKDNGDIDYTRDVLLVTGKFKGELLHILVNHWPSRREGIDITESFRIKAANLVRSIIDSIYDANGLDSKVIVMGDFNDNPNNKSIKKYLVADDLFNPMEKIFKEGKGTISFKNEWNLFDQILFTKNFFDSNSKLSFLSAEIFDRDWLKFHRGKLKGTPFRTYIGPWYKGGYSDHFPVNLFLQLDR